MEFPEVLKVLLVVHSEAFGSSWLSCVDWVEKRRDCLEAVSELEVLSLEPLEYLVKKVLYADEMLVLHHELVEALLVERWVQAVHSWAPFDWEQVV